MKQILLSVCCALLALGTYAQAKKSTGPTVNAFSEDTHVLHTTSRAAGGGTGTIANQVDTIWYEDFGSGIPAGWTLSGTGSTDCPWVYSTDGSWGFFNGNNGTSGGDAISSTTAANGFMINDPDSANNAMNGQPSGTTYEYLSSYITTSAISTVGYPAVRLEFEQLFRYNNDPDLEVGVSTDGVQFTFFDVKGDVAANDQSPNPQFYSIDISAIAGNSPTVYLRFGWNARVYYWMIDDIRLVTPPDYDLAIDHVFYNGYTDSTQTRYYTAIPNRQAQADTLLMGAEVKNMGTGVSTNLTLNASVSKDGNMIWQSNSTPISLAANNTDSINLVSEFYPIDGIGDYSIRLATASDSSDYDSTNSIVTTNFLVTENEYRRDNDNSNQGNWFDAGSWEMLVSFEIFETDTAVAISCYFPDLSNGYGIDAGDPLSYFLYNGNNLSTPVASNEFYNVQAGQEDGWITLPLPATKLEPGTYYAGFSIFQDEVAIGTHSALNDDVPPFTVLSRIDGGTAADWGYRTDLLPFVRLITRDPQACVAVTIDIDGTVVDDEFKGSITTNVTGGTSPYSYQWTGPNSFTSSTQDLSNLNTKGVYTLVVTDADGCVSDPEDFIVAGVVSATNISNSDVQLKVFPNPAQESIKLTLAGASQAAELSYSIFDLSAKEMLSGTVISSGNQTVEINTNTLPNGVYFLNALVNDNVRFTQKIVISK